MATDFEQIMQRRKASPGSSVAPTSTQAKPSSGSDFEQIMQRRKGGVIAPQVKAPEPYKSTSGEAFVREAALGLAPAAAGVAAIPAGAAMGAPLGPIGSIGGAIISSLSAAYAASKAQDIVLPKIFGKENMDVVQQKRAASADTNPVASTLGQLSTSLPFFRPSLKSLKDLKKLPGALRDPVQRNTIAGRGAVDNAINVGAGGAIQGSMNAYEQNQDATPFNWTEFLANVGGGAALNTPTKLGNKIGLKTPDYSPEPVVPPPEPPPPEPTRKLKVRSLTPEALPVETSTPNKRQAAYAKKQGYEAFTPDDKLPSFQMGESPKSLGVQGSKIGAPAVFSKGKPAPDRIIPPDATPAIYRKESQFFSDTKAETVDQYLKRKVEGVGNQRVLNERLLRSMYKDMEKRQAPKYVQTQEDIDEWGKMPEQDGGAPGSASQRLPDELEGRRIALETQKEALKNAPEAGLDRYSPSRGTNAGGLSEAGTSKLINTNPLNLKLRGESFARDGDSIAERLGFADAEAARNAYRKFKIQRNNVRAQDQELKEDIANFYKMKKDKATAITTAKNQPEPKSVEPENDFKYISDTPKPTPKPAPLKAKAATPTPTRVPMKLGREVRTVKVETRGTVIKAKATPAKSVTVPKEQLPSGTGDERISRYAARMKAGTAKILAEDKDAFIEKYDLPTFNRMNQKTEMENAVKYVLENEEDALARFISGRDAPDGTHSISLGLALQEKATATGDRDLAISLASLKATRAGQDIALLRQSDPDDPFRAMGAIVDARRDQVARNLPEKYSKGKTSDQAIASAVKEETDAIAKELELYELKLADVKLLLDKMDC